MDRDTAARVLGVAPDAPPARVERAFRARVRAGHPDRFPPGSEAWEDANRALHLWLEARAALAPHDRPTTAVPGRRPPTAYAAPRDRSSAGFRSAEESDRFTRAWGYGWGAFLVWSAVLGVVVGATGASNDALPLWSPALAAIGAVSLGIGWRADRRLRDRAH